jgi:poly(beta-D-mannuronate) lyase
MKIKLLFSLILSFIISHNSFQAQENYEIKVHNESELKAAIKDSRPGNEIILINGTWKDLQIKFSGEGTEKQPIVLRAETPGKVKLEGQSDIKIGGNYLVVKDLFFTNGFTPSNSVIEFRIDKDNIANNSRVTNCVIEDYTQPNRNISDLWVLFWGRNNKLDHTYLAGKFNDGPTVRVSLKGNENIKNYHQITDNHFGPRPRKGGPKAETIQIGSSETSMVPSFVTVANNFFEECNGEVEVISNKSSFNEYRNNIFYKSEGSLVLRHGDYCVVDGNVFIGDGESPNYGGIRVVNTGHLITNNYFYNLKGEEFRSPLSIMNGVPKSPQNRYNQVTDVVVAHNSWIDCSIPWSLGVGANMEKEDFLPTQEIRSARPVRILMANNLVQNSISGIPLIQAYDKIDGFTFKNNIVNPKIEINEGLKGITVKDITFKKLEEFIFVPSENQDFLSDTYPGFEFEKIDEDIFKENRAISNWIGAFGKADYEKGTLFNKENYGPEWFSQVKPADKNKTIRISSKDKNEIYSKLASANDGDVIELNPGNYSLSKSLVIDKSITIKSRNSKNKAKLNFSGGQDFPAFELNPRANLTLENVKIIGNGEEIAFATKKDNMSYGYNLTVENSEIKNFNTILKAYKGSFADEISFVGTSFKQSVNGILLAAETDDLGDYNAEFLSIKNCVFEDIKKDVVNFYRGGYDESTIGGSLEIVNSSFLNCGENEEDNILIKNRGIVNVKITNNVLRNNLVETIALLWGEKGNIHENNKIENSGKFVVEQYLKQKIVY